MENKNIILLKHLPSVYFKLGDPAYRNQVEDNYDDYVVVDVTSNVVRDKKFMAEHPNFDKELSPFYIGPVVGPDGAKANIFEIFWQCGKVFPCHDNNGKPTEDFFKWRNEFYSKEKCSKDLMRHACKDLGFEHKDTKYFAYFDKDKKEYIPLNYVDARKLVYAKEYAKLIYNTDAYKWLKSLVDSGKKVALVDFDAFNYYSENAMRNRYKNYKDKCKKDHIESKVTLDDFLKIKTIQDVYNCSFLQVGHAFVIKMLLEGDIEVVNGEVIDHIGVLNN